VALCADALQIGLFPLLGVPGWVADDVIDVVVAIVLTKLVGWHWGFLPAFLTKLVPFVDMVPSWTLATWIATRGSQDEAATRS